MSRLFALVLAFVCGPAFGQANNQFSPDFKPEELYKGPSSEEKPWEEGELKLPGYPRPADLVEFQVSALSSFRFSIDATSVSVGADGIVRFAMVARSSSGNENVSYDGLRCKTGEYKNYANGRVAEKAWVPVRDAKWRAVEVKTVTRQYLVLMRDFFCPSRVPIDSASEGVDALKSGYHPRAVSNQPEYLRR